MPNFTFNENNRVELPTKHHGVVSLSKTKWEEICQQPERFYYKDNAEKISTALVNPDYVRHSHNYRDQIIYYKKFDTFQLGNKTMNSFVKYWAVIIDCKTKRICTVYPTPKPKTGKEYKTEVKDDK